jgi:hypothetical protein
LLFLSPFHPRTAAGKDVHLHQKSQLLITSQQQTSENNPKERPFTGRGVEMEKRRVDEPKRGQERELSKAQPPGGDVHKGAPDSVPVPGTSASSVQTTLPVKAASKGLEVAVPTRVDPLLLAGALSESARREQVLPSAHSCYATDA